MRKGRTIGFGLASLALALALGLVPSAWAQAPERPAKAYLGVLAERVEEKADQPGVVVRDISPNSPAARAGLKDGDVIVKAGDQEIKDVEALARLVARTKPGDKMTLHVLRDGKAQDLTVTMAERPGRTLPGRGELRSEKSHAFLGVQTQELTPELKKHLGIEAEKGVVVTEVVPNSGAAKAGLKQEDVITHVNGKAMARPDELREAIRGLEAGKDVMLKVQRGKETMELKAHLGEAPQGRAELPPQLREFERLFPEGGRRFGVNMPPIFQSVEKVQELESKVKDLEKRIQDLEKKLEKK